MTFKPETPGERPSLGEAVIGWIEESCASPASGEDMVRLTREQDAFLLRFYELDPGTCTRRYRRGLLSRPKGWGRSPFLAMIAIAEAFGPVVPDGWDAQGRPVGRPWGSLRPPWVQLLAVSEDQTRNAWLPLLDMVRDGPLIGIPGVDALATFVTLPHGGRLEYVTASAVSREGNRPVFAILDQTESWTTRNGGVRLAAAVRRNLGKTDGSSIEAPNAYKPGSGSVAEQSFAFARAAVREQGLLFDHREAPAVDLADDDAISSALRYAYGDSAAHPDGCVLHTPACAAPSWGAPLHRIARERLDGSTSPQDFRQFFLNQPTAASDAYITDEMLSRLRPPSRPLRTHAQAPEPT